MKSWRVHPGCLVGETARVGETLTLPPGSRVGEWTIIEDGVELQGSVTVWHWCHVRMGAVIGAGVSLGSQVYVGPGTRIGEGTRVGSGAQLHHPAVIGARVFVAPGVFLSNDKYPAVGKEFIARGVTIGDDAVICAGAHIMGGVTIGQGAVVGMQATVTRDVAAGEIVWAAGTAAKAQKVRGRHYPGAEHEHWGPVCPEETCHLCAAVGLEDWRDIYKAARVEQADAGQFVDVDCPGPGAFVGAEMMWPDGEGRGRP